MIPHRIRASEICGNGLKNRVTACRKRLRVNRTTQRIQVNNTEELFPETAPSVSAGEDYAPDQSVTASVVRRDYSSQFPGAESLETPALLLVAEQEVGIT